WRASNPAATPDPAPAAKSTPERVVVPFPTQPWTATPSPAEPGDGSAQGQRRAAGLPAAEWTTDTNGNGGGGSGVWN
ncbi:MAG: hypothetical protein ACR2G2_09235, partial [Pseudonocardia sp.]